MNRPAGTVAAWWANPLDMDAKHTQIPLQRAWEAPLRDKPVRARPARVSRSERAAASASESASETER
jgi:hypothetical protein